jgi:hypothetical protein
MRISGTGAGEPAGHRVEPSYFLFLASEGGHETRLGGEVRLEEEQLLPRAWMSMDRDGTVDDPSEGITCLSPLAPARPESHKSRVQAGLPRPAQADQPRLSASPLRLKQAAYRGV